MGKTPAQIRTAIKDLQMNLAEKNSKAPLSVRKSWEKRKANLEAKLRLFS